MENRRIFKLCNVTVVEIEAAISKLLVGGIISFFVFNKDLERTQMAEEIVYGIG